MSSVIWTRATSHSLQSFHFHLINNYPGQQWLNRNSFQLLTNPSDAKWKTDGARGCVFPPKKSGEAQRGHRVNWFPVRHQLINGSIWIGLGWVGALEPRRKQVMSQSRSSPQALWKVKGWSSSAGGRCSSDTGRCRTVWTTAERRGGVKSSFQTLTGGPVCEKWEDILWGVWRRSSSRSCSVRPQHTASSAPYSRSSPYWAVRHIEKHSVNGWMSLESCIFMFRVQLQEAFIVNSR